MAKAFSITVATADVMLAAFAARCNSGVVKLYNGAIPADVRTALGAQVVLAEAPMGATAFDPTFTTNGNNRVATATGTPFTDASANVSDTATFFRVFMADTTTPVWQGTVGTADADMIMAETNIITGGPVNIQSMSVSLPMT